MAANIATLRPYLQNFDLTGLMVEELGWNHLQSASTIVSVANDNYDLSPVAEKAGFAVYRCAPGVDGTTPDQNIRRQIERKVADTSYEHLIIFGGTRRRPSRYGSGSSANPAGHLPCGN